MLFTSSRRVRLTASVVSPQAVFICSTGVLAAASVPPGAETWNSILDHTHANVHESLKSTPAVQFTLSTCMIALHLWLFPFGATVSTPIPNADLFLVTIVHVGADTPHIVLDLRLVGHAVGPRCVIFPTCVAIASMACCSCTPLPSGLYILLRGKIS